MNCHELHLFFEDNPQIDAEHGFEVSEHVARCSDCGQFVEERRQLAKSLRRVRGSVCAVPESLDVAVRASFRQYITEQRDAVARPAYSLPSPILWGLTAAAAVLLVAAGLFLPLNKPATTVAVPVATHPVASIASTPTATAMPIGTTTNRPVGRPVTVARHKRAAPSSESPIAASRPTSLPEGFRRLMYCDELSCGSMDVIRVQLPSALVARPVPSLRQASGIVNADVLVGADGIARGIRIEE